MKSIFECLMIEIHVSRAQIDEIQKKQDKLNAFKNRKLNSSMINPNSKELRGESPTRRPLPVIKSSRSSSITRPTKRSIAVDFFSFFFSSPRFSRLELSPKIFIKNKKTFLSNLGTIYRDWFSLIDIFW